MFLKTVLADGTAEQTVIREMKARAAGARGDIEQIVRGVMADVQERGWDAVVEYAEKFDGKAPYIVEPSVLDAAYDACDPKLISALEKAAANIRDYHEQMLVKSWEWKRTAVLISMYDQKNDKRQSGTKASGKSCRIIKTTGHTEGCMRRK